MRKRGPKSRPVSDRIWDRVNVRGQDDCWIWTGATSNAGYGYINCDDGRQHGCHRVTYALFNGPIPDDLLVLHSCDVRSCVNPAHLRVGTHSDNVRDMDARGRRNESYSKKTHCIHGHEYTPENTYKYGRRRSCKECRRKTIRGWYLNNPRPSTGWPRGKHKPKEMPK